MCYSPRLTTVSTSGRATQMSLWSIVQDEGLGMELHRWPGLDNDIEVIAVSCLACKKTASSHLSPVAIPQHHGRDICRKWNGYHFIVAVDAYRKWPEVCFTSSTTPQANYHIPGRHFCHTWISMTLGLR